MKMKNDFLMVLFFAAITIKFFDMNSPFMAAGSEKRYKMNFGTTVSYWNPWSNNASCVEQTQELVDEPEQIVEEE